MAATILHRFKATIFLQMIFFYPTSEPLHCAVLLDTFTEKGMRNFVAVIYFRHAEREAEDGVS